MKLCKQQAIVRTAFETTANKFPSYIYGKVPTMPQKQRDSLWAGRWRCIFLIKLTEKYGTKRDECMMRPIVSLKILEVEKAICPHSCARIQIPVM